VKTFALAAFLAIVVAGCGGGSPSATAYNRAATKQCFETVLGIHSFPSVADDFVASTASNGALRVRLADNEVTVLFGGSPEEANNLADAYRRFRSKNVGIEDVLRTKDNAVLLWQLHPSDADATSVESCLK
jgi:hypothetical protein